MEACGGAHYWARRFQVMGHAVQLIAAQFVKPFVKSHKNDRHDAEAIAEAAARPTMRYVPVKSVEQQDIQTLHRIRSLLMKDRVAQINQIRGLLAEYGLVIPQNAERVRQQLPSILEGGERAHAADAGTDARFIRTAGRFGRADCALRSAHPTASPALADQSQAG